MGGYLRVWGAPDAAVSTARRCPVEQSHRMALPRSEMLEA